MKKILVVPLAVGLAALLAACSSAAPSSMPRPIPSVAADEVAELVAGRYTNTAFVPRVEVTVPDGWVTFHASRDFFDVALETDAGPTVLSFLNPSAYLTPDGAADATTPAEAIAALRAHESLSVSEPREVAVSGIAGLEVDVAASVDNTHIMRTVEGDIGIGPTNAVRFTFLQVGDDVLVIGILAPEGGMEEALEVTRAVRASIRIGE